MTVYQGTTLLQYQMLKQDNLHSGAYKNINANVNIHVYSPDIPAGSADFTIYTPGIGTHSFTVSSPLGRIQHLHTFLQL